MKTFNTIAPSLLALMAVTACGPGPRMVFDDTLSFSASSEDAANVTVFLTSPGSDVITTSNGRYNRDTDTFEVDALSGTYNEADGTIALNNGGTGVVSVDQEFSGLVRIEQASGTEFGVFGIPAMDVPTAGTANYAGESAVVIVDGTAVYDLTGTSSVDVDFAAARLKTTIDNLNGTRTDAATVTDVTDVAQMDLTFITVDDGAFEGGFFDLFSDQLSTFESGSEQMIHNGALFGPNAEEIGGVFNIDDTDTGTLLIHGVYAGDR